MEINDNPYGLFEIFRRDVSEYLIKKVKARELDLTLAEAYKLSSDIEFKSIDHNLEWESPLTDLLSDETIFELNLLWRKILNP